MVRATGITLAAILLTIRAEAATNVVPQFSLESHAADNVRLLDDTTVSDTASSIVFNASLDATIFNENGFLTLEPRIMLNAYSDAENNELDGDDLFLETRGEYSWQTATAGFRSDYRRQSIIRSELPGVDDPDFDDDIGVDDPGSVDSGRLIFVDQDRERFNIRPFVAFAISERTDLRFETFIEDVSYSGSDTTLRTGYDSRSLRASVIRRANERNSITATLRVNNYEASGTGNETDSVGIIGAINRRVSDLWTVNLEAGVERFDYTFVATPGAAVDNASVQYMYQVRARRTGQRTRMEYTLGKRQDPSSTGFVVDRNHFRFFVGHEFTERLSMRIALRADETSNLGGAVNINDRDYLRAEFGLTWRMRPKWSIFGGYNYISQDFVNEFADARSSGTIYIGIGYEGLSRPGAP